MRRIQSNTVLYDLVDLCRINRICDITNYADNIVLDPEYVENEVYDALFDAIDVASVKETSDNSEIQIILHKNFQRARFNTFIGMLKDNTSVTLHIWFKSDAYIRLAENNVWKIVINKPYKNP